MKRKILGLTALLFLGLGAKAHAYDYWSLVKDKTVVVVATQTFTGVGSTTTVLIDLSDTVNFPHKVKGTPRQINITSLEITIDRPPESTGTVRIGVVTFISASTGSVTWFDTVNFLQNTSIASSNVIKYTTGEYFLKLRVDPLVPISSTDGATPFLLSSLKTSGTTVLQSDVFLRNPAGTAAAPDVGDVIMEFTSGAVTVDNITVRIGYHAE